MKELEEIKQTLKKRNVEIWDLKENYRQLLKENTTLKTQLDLKDTKIDRLEQIIKILDKGYKHFMMTGKFALDFSEEAQTMCYNDMHILQIMLEDIVKGVSGYED